VSTYDPSVFAEPELDLQIEVGVSARVILYNDEEHTFEEVSTQLMRATGCSSSEAEALTLTVHFKGKAMVFEGEIAPCLKVSGILEEIDLTTQVEC